MLTKTTRQYAFHDLALDCDIYEDETPSRTNPVLLYFHPGSLTGGTRALLPPWLVQACYHRRWSLISASYRFLPQVPAKGLVEDALAAYAFARMWRVTPGDPERRVIVVGASAGFFMANLICHHETHLALPLAMLSITGSPTFQHDFYRSSILTSPKPIQYQEVRHWLEGPLVAADLPRGEPSFDLEMLLPDGGRNSSFVDLEHQDITQAGLQRWDLYDYYVHNNAYPSMLADIDPGFEKAARLREGWPKTILLQGGDDPYLPISIAQQVVDVLGEDRACLLVADGQPHLFESTTYLEDDSISAETVKAALNRLDDIVVDK